MKWYQKTWVIILLLIFFFPVGVFFLWKEKKSWKKQIKIALSVVMGVWFLGSVGTVFSDSNTENVVSNKTIESKVTESKTVETSTKSEELTKKETEEKAKQEEEKLAQEKAEQERIEQEKAEEERKAQEAAAEAERVAQEKAEQERIAQEQAAQAEAERKAQEQVTQSNVKDYVLNTSTKKFHNPSCRDVSKIKAENYSTISGTRDDAINAGYSPCGHCNP